MNTSNIYLSSRPPMPRYVVYSWNLFWFLVGGMIFGWIGLSYGVSQTVVVQVEKPACVEHWK